MEKYLFKIRIGALPDHGHGQSVLFTIESNKQLSEVREAFFKAKEMSPEFNPENLCPGFVSLYGTEEHIYKEFISEKVFMKMIDDGFVYDGEYKSGDYYPTSKDMLKIVLWFISKGDPELQLEPVLNSQLELFNSENSGIESLGYGLREFS